MAVICLLWMAADAYLPDVAPGPMTMMGLSFLVALVFGVPMAMSSALPRSFS